MRIGGYQPTSLIDYPMHVCATVFTQGCPFRCTYCHNPDLIPLASAEELPEEAVLARIARDAPLLDGVCITGGEPTVHPDLPQFLHAIKRMGLHVKLDTNGMHPRMVERCLSENLVDFLAMDIKHTWERYTDIIGAHAAAAVPQCTQTFHIIQTSGITHEFRTTTAAHLHTEDDLLTMAGYLLPGETYALQALRTQKTLNPQQPHPTPHDYARIASRMREAYPELRLVFRV